MASVIVIGDGPAGLSTALFLAKNGHQVLVYAQDKTPMHFAELHNYLGIEVIDGGEFQRRARHQVEQFGAAFRDEAVTALERNGDGFVVRTDEGGEDRADYVVLAGGKAAQGLAQQVGAKRVDGRVVVDTEYATDVDRLYAVGRVARPERSQAIISAGAGATAALDILAREAGRDITDWDTPPEE
jgi:thioredoxin reductase (NADPH)